MSSSRGSRPSGPQLKGTANQQSAIASIRNIANFSLERPQTPPFGSGIGSAASTTPPDADAVTALLHEHRHALPVADVSRMLNWDADRTARALTAAEEMGSLQFYERAGILTVMLK